AADALGLSDIGKIIDPKDFDKTDIDEYVFNEDNEKIFVVIKSKTDEYCFTNTAFIHLDGKSAASKKRNLKRYPYRYYQISNVSVETAGTIDLDAEIKFKIGDEEISIDIDKKQMERIRDIYKALFKISEKYKEIHRYMGILQHTHEAINKMFVLKELTEQVVLNLPDIINQTAHQVELHYINRQNEIQNYDFGSIFERYIKS
ncbi:MAG: PH domain-containing protein, partial [Desulfamplus sp.]|nr:PH domain-containing protein [Desulfamplus sp.]